MSVGMSRLSATAWDALSSDHAKEFVRTLAREARSGAGAPQGRLSDRRCAAGRAAARWEQLVRDRLPHTVSTNTLVDASGQMWMGMWMTWHRGTSLSGTV